MPRRLRSGRGRGIGNIVRRVKSAFAGPRGGPPPAVRKYLEAHKDHPVTMLSVCRVPIHSAIDKALEWMTLGEWGKAKKRKGFDEMFHLYLLIGMGDHSALTERNQVVRLENAPEGHLAEGDCVPVRVKPGMTLGSLFAKGEGGPDWWVYDPIERNCQDYVSDLLQGSGVMTPELKKFIKQDTADLLPGFIHQFARKITDVAAAADILIKGEGIIGNMPYVKPRFVKY